MNSLKIDLYTEVTCPWCIIGQHRLDKVLAEHFPTLAVDIEHYPVILLPDCPDEGLDIPQLMRVRYGITDPSIAWARPHAEARGSGLPLDLSVQMKAYPTLRAHTLVRLARARGTQHALAVAISAAYFLKGANINDAEVLADIAVAFGFERAETLRLVHDPRELERTRQQVSAVSAKGIRSVPHFIIAERLEVSGSPSEAALVQAVANAARESA